MGKKTEFNYCIGHYWGGHGNHVGTYTYHSEVHYGTMKDAKKFLKYVEKQSPEHDWTIFQLVEIPE